MTSNEVQELIKIELKSKDNRSDAALGHGLDLNQWLLAPTRIKVMHSFKNELVEVWMVLEEDPIKKEGYKIIYSEEEELFGLAVCASERDDAIPTLIGFYGGVLDTLYAM